MLLKILISLIFVVNLASCRTSEKLKVQLPDGSKIVGRYLTSDSGRGIRAFMGIPYAEPPLGELRFRSPVKKKPWNGVLKAHFDGSVCTQRDPFRRDQEIVGSEDCLFINVFAPETISATPLPVMVFFHGGGFMCGSGIKSFYGPDYLLDHDVIYIGANYRLGPLGFLSTEQEDCSGNFGLKDQKIVLKWIQENIAVFNGDPNLVTIFGESAGGASVTYHMMSQQSKGLFHRAISESGTYLSPWAAVAHSGVAKKRALKLADMMGCSLAESKTNNYRKMIDCLRTVSAENITAAFYDFFEWDTDPMIPFPPVVEKSTVKDAFITEDPRFKTNPHGLDIPWMTGITSEEGAMKSAPIINLPEVTNDILENWDRALPISLYYDHFDESRQKEITKEINRFYFGNQKLIESTRNNLTNLYTDAWFFVGMHDYLRNRLANQKKENTFVYLFTHKGSASFTEIFKGGSENFYGTSHAEELQYLFPIRKDLPYFFNSIPSSDDKTITKLLVKLWVNFAYTGNPNDARNDSLPMWETATDFPLKYMRIGNMNGFSKNLLSMEKDLYSERAEFWWKLKAHFPVNNFPKEKCWNNNEL